MSSVKTAAGRHRRHLDVDSALRVMRSLDRSTVKRAELGGDGQDAPFEQAFSNLAHAHLRDKAPSLLDHELGFQLMDRNQENTKAMGVFGFKVGSHLLLAPVFFLQGDLKGHELLYIKKQDLFVPLKENWLNYILNRKPNMIGESVSRNTSELGVVQPDLNRLSQSPWKYASDGFAGGSPDWLRDALPSWCAAATMNTREELAKYAEAVNLPRFCREFASTAQLAWLIKQARTYPAVARSLDEHHGVDFLFDAVRRAKAREQSVKSGSVLDPGQRLVPIYRPRSGSVLDPAHPVKSGALKVIEYDATQETDLPESVDEEDREKLLRDGMLVEDHRDGEEVSVAYNVRVEQRLFNPTETGLYMVLVKPGGYEKCFIAHNPHGPNGRHNFVTVVRADEGTRNWVNCHPTKVWCASRIEDDEYRDWLDALPEADSVSGDGRHMIVGQRGNATLPFRVEKTLGDERGGTVYEVDFSTHCEHRYAEGLTHPTFDRYATAGLDHYDPWHDGQRVHLGAKQGTDLRSSNGDLWVPEGCKKLKLSPAKAVTDEERDDVADSVAPKDPDDHSDHDAGRWPIPDDHFGTSEPPPIRPGNMLDAELEIMTTTSALRVKHAGVRVHVNGREFTPNRAAVHLIVDHGLREKAARDVLAEARRNGARGYECRIKYANPYLTQGGPVAPGFPGPQMGGDNVMGFTGPTMSESEYALGVPGMEAGDNRGAYDVRPGAQEEPMDFGTIQRAVGSGQKEVFDTAMIGSMLKAVREDTMIDRYIPDLLKGMDRLGRMLFMFYWHGDTFADRYGKQDLPELEDTLRNAFEMLGDAVLFLKQKTIEPYPEEDAVSLDLNAVAG